MNEKYLKVEFDPAFHGGDYSGNGNFALVPEVLADCVGMEKAFEQTTGHVAANIVQWDENERFNILGERFQVELPQAEGVQLPEVEGVQLESDQPVELAS